MSEPEPPDFSDSSDGVPEGLAQSGPAGDERAAAAAHLPDRAPPPLPRDPSEETTRVWLAEAPLAELTDADSDPPKPVVRDPSEETTRILLVDELGAELFGEEPGEEPVGEEASGLASEPADAVDATAELAALISQIDAEVAARPLSTAEPSAALARPVATTLEQLQHIMFSLAGTRYALPITQVFETNTVPDLTTVPMVPEWVRGVMNLRGDVVAVLDPRRLFALPERDASAGLVSSSERILIVHDSASQRVAGLLVDEVNGIVPAGALELVQPTAQVPARIMPFVRGVSQYAEKLLVVLDVDRLFAAPEIQQLEDV